MYQLSSWFTDLMDVYRVEAVTTGALTRQERVLVAATVPCRIYSPQKSNLNLRQAASAVYGDEKLACAVDTDIEAGDELIVTRGAALGRKTKPVRYIASQPVLYFDPVGAAATGLEHMEVGIHADNVV